MKKQALIFIAVLLIIGFTILSNQNLTDSNQEKEISQLCFQETCFQVQLAQTTEERKQGLSNQEHLPENQGMLFIFQQSGNYGFWMKDMKIPLDIIWLDQNLEVIEIITAQPCKETCTTHSPTQKAKYVLEINAGLATKYNIEIKSKAKTK